VESLPVRDKRRHNCLSLGNAVQGELPQECWQKLEHPFKLDALGTIPAYLQGDSQSDITHKRRVELARLILNATQTGELASNSLSADLSKFTKRELNKFLHSIPTTSQLFDLVEKRITDVTQPLKESKQPKPEKPVICLPAEFQRALDMYAEASARRAKIKIERGHKYDSETATRRVDDAKRLCEFFTQNGVVRWADVAARHLDDYIVTVNRHAAQRAWTFLNFLHGRVPLLSKIPRPRNKPRHSGEMVASLEEAKSAISRLAKLDDLQIALAGLFLAMYAQNISHCSKLKQNQFRRDEGGLQVKFHGDWMPLDSLTEQLICKYRTEYAEDGYIGSEQLFFSYPRHRLSKGVSDTAEVDLKQLRLAAISNLLRSGMTDRGAIVYFLGVSMPTIEDVERTTYWDLQSSVSPEIVEARNEVIRGERTE